MSNEAIDRELEGGSEVLFFHCLTAVDQSRVVMLV